MFTIFNNKQLNIIDTIVLKIRTAVYLTCNVNHDKIVTQKSQKQINCDDILKEVIEIKLVIQNKCEKN